MKTLPNENQLCRFSVQTQGMFCLDCYLFHKERNTKIERNWNGSVRILVWRNIIVYMKRCGICCILYATCMKCLLYARVFPLPLFVCLFMPSSIPTWELLTFATLHYQMFQLSAVKGSGFTASSVSVSILPWSFLGPRFQVMVISSVPQIKDSSCTRDNPEGLNVLSFKNWRSGFLRCIWEANRKATLVSLSNNLVFSFIASNSNLKTQGLV